MKNIKYIFLFLLVSITGISCVDTNLPDADASFVIEKDTIIDNKKARVEITVADTINPVYFVYKGASMHNTVWTGDKEKATASVRAEGAKRPSTITYYISHDYNSKNDSLIMTWSAKKDTAMTQGFPLYQGVALATGSKEMKYTFKSKGNLIVTWIAVNVNEREQNEAILQKPIVVK
jgi:hypothetical protein